MNRWRGPWLTVHKYIGLVVGLFIAVNALSGSAVVFFIDTDAALEPQRHYVTPGSRRLAISDLVPRLEQAYPGYTINDVRQYGVVARDDYAYMAKLEEPNGRIVKVALNPYSGEILGETDYNKTLLQILEFHADLFAGRPGAIFVAFVGLALLASAVTGIVLWWPKPGRLARAFKVRLRSPSGRFVRDLHSVAGIYLYVVLVVLALTGVILGFPEQSRSLIGNFAQVREGSRTQVPASVFHGQTRALSVREVEERATALYPGTAIEGVTMARGPAGSYLVRLGVPGADRWATAKFVAFDQYSGDVLSVFDHATVPLGNQIVDIWARHLHGGYAGGLPLRITILLSGVMVAVLFVTGIMIWLRQRR